METLGIWKAVHTEQCSFRDGEVSSLHRVRAGGLGLEVTVEPMTGLLSFPFSKCWDWNPGLCVCQASFLIALPFFEMRPYYLPQCGLRLLGSADPHSSACWTEVLVLYAPCLNLPVRQTGAQWHSACLVCRALSSSPSSRTNKTIRAVPLGSSHIGVGACPSQERTWAGARGLYMEGFLCLLAPELLSCHF